MCVCRLGDKGKSKGSSGLSLKRKHDKDEYPKSKRGRPKTDNKPRHTYSSTPVLQVGIVFQDIQ